MTKHIWFDDYLLEDLDAISSKCTATSGQIIRENNIEQHGTLIVVDGELRLWAAVDMELKDDCQNILLDEISAVDVVGSARIANTNNNPLIVETMTSTEYYEIDNQQLFYLMDRHKALRNHIYENLTYKLRMASDRIRDAYTLSAKERVIREVIRLSLDSNTNIIKQFPRHNILAAKCGVTRETVSRTLAQLIKKQIIKRKGRSIIIQNQNELEEAFVSIRGDKS